MKRYVILWTVFLTPILAYGQKCGLEESLVIPLSDSITYDIVVEDQYIDPNLATNRLCEVEIYLVNNDVYGLEIDLISPAGQRISLFGPNDVATECCVHTIGLEWDISFVQDAAVAEPDTELAGLGDIWDNRLYKFDLRSGKRVYTGSYKPFSGRLEDFDLGTVHGTWQLEIKNFPGLFAGGILGSRIIDFRLIFCDESGKPPCCDADAGFINTSLDIEACAGSDTLNLLNIGPGYIGRRPDSLEYSYRFLVSNNGVLVGNDSVPDLTGYPAGNYQICGLSFKKEDEASIPVPDGILTMSDIKDDLNGPTPSFCADITENCIDIVITGSSEPTNLVETICNGQSFAVGDSVFNNTGIYQVLLSNQAGCDSLVNLNLTVADLTRDTLNETICQGESFTVGTSTYDTTGVFRDTLQSVALCDSIVVLNLSVAPALTTNLTETICQGDSFTIGTETFTDAGSYQVNLQSTANCDSIVNLELSVVQVSASILPPDNLNCENRSLQLDGSMSDIGTAFALQWNVTNGGNIAVGDATLTPTIDAPGTYELIIENKESGCQATATVDVIDTINTINAVITTPDPITCRTPTISVNGSASSAGPNVQYAWITSDGNIVSDPNLNSIDVDGGGQYQLTVLDTFTRCSATESVDVPVVQNFPNADAGNSTLLNCLVSEAVLDGGSSTVGPDITYSWTGSPSILDPSAVTTSTTEPGTYLLTVTEEISGCIDIDTVIITQNLESPVISSLTSPELTCATGNIQLEVTATTSSNDLSFAWSGPGIVSGENTATPLINRPGNYSVSVTDNLSGCTTTESTAVVGDIDFPTADAGSDQTINCNTSEVSLGGPTTSSGPQFEYLWFSNEGNLTGGITTSVSTADAAGVYGLIVTNTANSCADTSLVNVFADTIPPFTDAVANDLLSCSVPSIIIDGTNSEVGPNISYNWSGPCIVSPPDAATIEVNCEGTYLLRIENTLNGCVNIDSVMVGVDTNVPIAVLNDTAFVSCVSGLATIDATSSGGGTTEWFFNEIELPTNSLNPTFSEPGSYTLVVTNILAGCSDTARVEVVSDCQPVVSLVGIPDTISCDRRAVDLMSSVSPVGPDYRFQWTTAAGVDCLLDDGDAAITQVSCPGEYQLIVVNDVLQVADTLNLQVIGTIVEPSIQIFPPLPITCQAPNVVLDASNSSSGPGLFFTWTNEQGDTIGNQNTLSVATGGIYTLELSDQNSGCSTVDIIEVVDRQSFPTIIFEDAIFPCFEDSIAFSAIVEPANEDYAFVWSGPGITNEDTSSTVMIQSVGLYTLEVTNLSNSCSTTESIDIVQPSCPPCVSTTEPAILNCNNPAQNLEITFCEPCVGCTVQWTTVDGQIDAGATTLTPEISQPGTYVVSATNLQGLSSRETIIVSGNFETPIANAGTDQILTCSRPEISIGGTTSSVGPTITYDWTDAANQSIAADASPLIRTAGVFTLNVMNTENGCSATDQVAVTMDTISPRIQILAPGDLNCNNETIALDASGSTVANTPSFNWESATGQSIGGSTSARPIIGSPGAYTLTLRDDVNGCETSETVTITADNTRPNIQPIPDGSINCRDTEVTLTGNTPAATGFTFQWCSVSPDGVLSDCIPAINLAATTPGRYAFQVINDGNGCDSTVFVSVIEDTTAPDIEAGLNDTLTCRDPELVLQGSILNGSAPTLVSWSALNNSPVSDASILDPVVANPDDYILSVTNLDNFCVSQDTVRITQNIEAPVIDAGLDQLLDCSTETLELVGEIRSSSGNVAVSWSTDDGNIISPTGNNTLLIDAAGTYQFSVADELNGCLQTDEVQVTSNEELPTANIADASALQLSCLIDTITLDAGPSFTESGTPPSFSWSSFSSENRIIGGVTNPSVQVSGLGIYRVIVEDPTNFCKDTLDVTVGGDFTVPDIVFATPGKLSCAIENITIDASSSSSGNDFTYTWRDGDGISLNIDKPQVNINRPGNYELTILNTINGCSITETVSVESDNVPPIASILQPDILDCVRRTTDIDGSRSSTGSQYSYSWNSPNGAILSGQDSTIARIREPGTYTLMVTNAQNGCTAEASVEVSEVASPITGAEITTIDPKCGDDKNGNIIIESVQTGTDPFTYALADGIFTSNNQFSNLAAGTYPLTIQGSDGCTWDTEVTLNPPQEINIDLGPDQTIMLGDSILLNASIDGDNIERIYWEPIGQFTDSNALSQTVKPFENSLYKVFVTNTDGCTASDQVLIKVNRADQVYFPTAFSPNGDESNDLFTIYAGNNVRQINRLQIFSRWGTLVYSRDTFAPNDPSIGWDGTYNGSLLNPAVFVYYAEIEFVDGVRKLFKGDIALVR